MNYYNWTATGLSQQPRNPFGVAQYVNANDYERERDRLAAALRGMLAIEDSVTAGQCADLRREWIPEARAALAASTGESTAYVRTPQQERDLDMMRNRGDL